MATIKSFTSLEQSKKLAEILPLESADMFCADVFNKKEETHSYNFHILSTWGCNTFEELKDRENKFVCFIPVWSLAALLDVLPRGEYKHTYICFGGYKGDKYISEWFCSYEQQEPFVLETYHADNPVDACVAMIEKLHELKLL